MSLLKSQEEAGKVDSMYQRTEVKNICLKLRKIFLWEQWYPGSVLQSLLTHNGAFSILLFLFFKLKYNLQTVKCTTLKWRA